MKRFLLCLGVLCAAQLTAQATWPPDESAGSVDYSSSQNWPSDPDYSGQWEYWSFVPPAMMAQVDDRTRRLGLGGNYDRAWARETGDPRVLISVIDSGVYWEEKDLVNKIHLNAGELPPSNCPGANGSHDANGDGRFNVQDYTTATGHQQPAFSLVCDTRITTDFNGNGLLDAEDLIHTFSDGVDDDGNGYIDDISGWDFFHNDNDPLDDTRFGHGTGEMTDSSSETNNGLESAGVCPECSIMMLRGGDSFVLDTALVGLAITYATDNGVSIVQAATGGLDNTPFAKQAIDYAYANNVTIVMGGSDEDSFHHNYPDTNNHTLSVHAIRYDQKQWQQSTSFFAYNNCSNYGAEIAFSVAALDCSSGAIGRTAGMVGLLYSAALKAGLPPPSGKSDDVRRITPEEIKQTLIRTIDNFYDPADATDSSKYPTEPGWSRRFGYGRTNGRSAVDAVLGGQLPPEVEIRSPGWFDIVHNDVTKSLIIDGRIAVHGQTSLPAGDSFDYVVEYAPGIDADDSAFKPIDHAEMVSQPIDGTLATWNISGININNPVPKVDSLEYQPDDPSNIHLVTVRVRVTLHSSDPTVNGLTGEARRAIHILKDPDLLKGFPVRIGASGESSPKIVDLLGDKKREVVIGDSAGMVHAIRADGSELSGWPVFVETLAALDANGLSGAAHGSAPAFAAGGLSANVHSPIIATVAVGDVDGDGAPDVVAATEGGYVWAFHADGTTLKGFPVHGDFAARLTAVDASHVLDDGITAAPVLADFNQDGKLDILIASHDGNLYLWSGDGSRLPGFPVALVDTSFPDDPTAKTPRQHTRIVATPAVGDLNGDGTPDIAVGSSEVYTGGGRFYLIDGRGSNAPNGAIFPHWPIQINSLTILPIIGTGLPNSPALADINGDGVPEILITPISNELLFFGVNGNLVYGQLDNEASAYGAKTNAIDNTGVSLLASPAVGDLDNDGSLDAVQGTASGDLVIAEAIGGQRHDFEHHVDAWDIKTGKFKVGFPRVIEEWQFLFHPAIADVSGDDLPETINASAGYFVHAWNVNGSEPSNFPKFTGGWMIASPAVGDLDGDGKLELAISTRDGNLFAWHTDGSAKGRIDWPSYHHDSQNTGNFAVALDEGTLKVLPHAHGCDYSAGAQVDSLFALSLIVAFALAMRFKKSAG